MMENSMRALTLQYVGDLEQKGEGGWDIIEIDGKAGDDKAGNI